MFFAIIAIISTFISTGNKIEITDAWLRTGAKGLNSALYFKIENHSDKTDTLYKVSSDIAQHIMMHKTYRKNDMMGMKEIKDIAIKPNSSVEFRPGGYHVMLMNLTGDIKKGDKLGFILYFKSAGEVNVNAIAQNR